MRAFEENGTSGFRAPAEEAWYRSLVEKVPAVLYVDTSYGSSSALYINPWGESLLGYTKKQWLEDREFWVKTLHPDDRERVLAEHLRARGEDGPFESEYRLVARDGSVVWVRDEATPVEDAEGWPGRRVGVLLDITERKLYEERLRRSEERFRLVSGVTGEAIWDNDLSSNVQEWDGATEALFGYSPHQGRTGEWWEERIHPDDKERVLSGLAAVLASGAVWKAKYRFRRADGSYAHVLDRGCLVRDGEGRPVRMVGSMKDVTERREHEEELRRSEELFRRTFEAAAVGIAHLTPDGSWLRINDALCEISGYPREELLGMSYLDLTLPEDLEASRERTRQLLAGEKGPYSVERRFVRKDGSRVWANVAISLLRNPTGEPDYLVCVAEDVTARKIRELIPEPLTRRQAEVLGRMVAGRRNPQIARDLSMSLGTTKREVSRVLAKFGVSERDQAAARAVDIGLMTPPGNGASAG
jgi:PAS domain S-box-containing protein